MKETTDQVRQSFLVNPTQAQGQVILMPPVAEEEVDWAEMGAKIRGSGRRIVCSFCLAFVLGAAASFLVTPVYTATVLLTPAATEESGGIQSKLSGQLGGLVSMAGVSLGGDTSVKQAIATLKSRLFTQSFITQYQLLPIIFYEDWDESAQAFKKPGWFKLKVAKARAWLAGKEIDVSQMGHPSAWRAFKKFNKMRNVVEMEDEGLVKLNVTWEDPRLAAEWANAMVALLNKQMRQSESVEAQKSIAYLRKEINKTNLVDLRETLYHLIEEQTQIAMLTNVRDDYVFKVIDPAVVPEEKSAPRRGIMAMAAGFLALLLTGGWALMRRTPEGEAA